LTNFFDGQPSVFDIKSIEGLQIWDQAAQGVEILNDYKNYITT
jgi:hypothetical protein